MKPDLTKLRVLSNSTEEDFWAGRLNRDNQMEVARYLAPSLSLWKNTLVSLTLDCIIDVPQLLLVASKTVWPNLDRMDLVGVIESGVNPFRLREDQIVACDDLLRGIVVALPSMPALTKLGTRFRNADDEHFAFSFCMDIGGRRGGERQARQLREHGEARRCAITPCRPVPIEHAIAKAQGIVPPGDLTTELQSAVWRERGLWLAVFSCTEHQPWAFSSNDAPCTQWDKEAWEWELVFKDGIDPLIYTIGQYAETEMGVGW